MLSRFVTMIALVCALQTFDASTETYSARRTRLEKLTAASPAWRLVETPSYFVFSDVDDRTFLEEFGQRATSLRALLESEFDPPLPSAAPRPTEVPSVISFHHDLDSFRAAGGGAGSVGDWNRVDQQILLPDTGDGEGRVQAWRALQSLVVAEFFDRRLDVLRSAPWFLYGQQDYFAGFELKHKKWVAKPHPIKLQLARELLKRRQHVPLEAFFALKIEEYNGNSRFGLSATDCWAQGWSLVWFLRQGSKSKDWNPRWGEILPRYLKALRTSRDPVQAHHFAFDGVAIDALEKAWIAHTLERTR